MDEKIEQ